MATPRRSDNEGSEHQTYENVAFDSGPDNLNNNRYSINEIPQDYEENSKASFNGYEKCVMKVQSNISGFFKNYSREIGTFVKVILFLLYFAYFGYALYYSFGDEGSVRLLACTVIGLLLIILKISRQLLGQRLSDTPECCSRIASQSRLRLFIRWSLRIIVFSFLVVFVIVDVALDSPSNLTSVGGMMAFLVIVYLTSTNPAKVYWHPVFWGIALQYMFALLILRTYSGYEAFTWLGARVTEFLSFADEGAQFVFDKEYYTRHNFAFKIMPIVVYFCAVINILYYLGVMQFIVRHFGRFLSFCLNTTPAESVNAAANIFVSMIDAPLMIKPFLEDMTDSELHAVMTGGFATIAGGLFGAYTAFGVPANHLISASIMSAPAALAISKLTCPETETTIHSKRDFSKFAKSQEKNLLEAASAGATQSVKLVAAIMVNVMAFLSLLKFVNSTLAWFGSRIGVANLSFQLICSYVLFPVSLFMGTEIADCRKVAELVGIKTFTNEFIAYDALSTLIHNKASFLNYTSQYNKTEAWKWDGDDIVLTNWNNHVLVGGVLSDRSTVIATYALCGFSNFGSIGITLGVLGTLVPSKKRALSKLVMRAMIAGNLACFLTACIAGLLYKDYG